MHVKTRGSLVPETGGTVPILETKRVASSNRYVKAALEMLYSVA